jgi:NADH-quinone oxidoreductase subunit E
MEVDVKKVGSLVERNGGGKNALISILQDVQAEYNWLPREAIIEVARKLDIPLIDVYAVATFYRQFSLKPRGKHIVTVCVGTACHVRGGTRIAEEISHRLDVELGETTKDMQFTLETVNCLGCCAIGPVVVMDGEYYGEMNARKAGSLLAKHVR